ncbi:hypothetical protein APHAL10511_007817 [Amanita phalloides]|nr:hypothetical protein APHAL10511_007817 [Amanita phalloides]
MQRGFFSAHGNYFGGYFEIDGKHHPFAGKFDQFVEDLAVRAVNIEYDNVEDLKGVYTIGPRARLHPLLIPLEKGSIKLRIIVYVRGLSESSHEVPITGQLAWLPE